MPRLPCNIIKRGRKFYFRTEVGGKQIWRSLGEHLSEARRRAAILRVEIRQGTLTPAPEPEGTVSAFYKRWLTEYVKQRRKGKGMELAKQRCRTFILPVIGKLSPTEVKVPHLRAIRTRVEKDKLSPQSVKHVLSDTRCLLRYALECGLTATVPSFREVMPRLEEVAPRRISDEQLAEILPRLPKGHDFLVRLALETGLRWGEIKNLQWRHVVWAPHAHLVVEHTKSGKVRRVPLSEEAVCLLEEERARTSSVFVSPIRGKNGCNIAYRSGVKFHWTFHQLRHTFACRWLEHGGSKESLQKMLGHSTIRLTERYGHLADEFVFAEAERIMSRSSTRSKSRSSSVEAGSENVLSSSAN